MDDDNGPPTPHETPGAKRDSSIQLSFAASVRELNEALRLLGTPVAVELFREGTALAITFDSWAKFGNPSVAERNRTYFMAQMWVGVARDELKLPRK